MKSSIERKEYLKEKTRALFIMVIGIMFLTAGSALGIIAGLGQTTSTGTSSSIGMALGVKVGTAMFLLYGVFFLLQLMMLGRKFKWTRLIQMLPVVLNMLFLNFFRYNFAPFAALHPESYAERAVIFLVGMLIISFGFTVVRYSEFANYPPESFCTLVAERTGLRFGTVKIILDFVYVGLSLLVCHLMGVSPEMVREGTLIFAVCNGILINFYTPYVRKAVDRIRSGKRAAGLFGEPQAA